MLPMNILVKKLLLLSLVVVPFLAFSVPAQAEVDFALTYHHHHHHHHHRH